MWTCFRYNGVCGKMKNILGFDEYIRDGRRVALMQRAALTFASQETSTCPEQLTTMRQLSEKFSMFAVRASFHRTSPLRACTRQRIAGCQVKYEREISLFYKPPYVLSGKVYVEQRNASFFVSCGSVKEITLPYFVHTKARCGILQTPNFLVAGVHHSILMVQFCEET